MIDENLSPGVSPNAYTSHMRKGAGLRYEGPNAVLLEGLRPSPLPLKILFYPSPDLAGIVKEL